MCWSFYSSLTVVKQNIEEEELLDVAVPDNIATLAQYKIENHVVKNSNLWHSLNANILNNVDIELDPGPTRYFCEICERPVGANHKGHMVWLLWPMYTHYVLICPLRNIRNIKAAAGLHSTPVTHGKLGGHRVGSGNSCTWMCQTVWYIHFCWPFCLEILQ